MAHSEQDPTDAAGPADDGGPDASGSVPAAKKATKKRAVKRSGAKKPGAKKRSGAKKSATKKSVAEVAAAKDTRAATTTTATEAGTRKKPAPAAGSEGGAPVRRSRVTRIDPDAVPAEPAGGVGRGPADGDPVAPTGSGGQSEGATEERAAGHPDEGPFARWAVSASVTEELLNDLVVVAVGDGIAMEAVEQEVNLPAMGEVRLRLALTVTAVRFDLRSTDDGRARVTVSGAGDVAVRATDYEGDVVEGAAAGFPVPPAPLPVALTALAQPFLELRDDHTVSVGLDLRHADLVTLGVDPHAEVPEGVDADAWAGILNMTSMMFTMMGDHLWEGLAEAVGTVGLDLGEDVGMILKDLGVDPGPAHVRVSSGLMSFALPAHVEVEGHAEPVPVAGRRLGVGMARSGVDRLARTLFERAVGGLPLPFELEIDLGEQQVGSRLRQTRLVSERFPDLRASVRTEVGVRLVRGRLEITVSSAWVEFPPVVPGVVNAISRRLGGLMAMAPLRFRFPATMQVPLVPGSTDTVAVRVDDLRVTGDGIGVVLELG